MLMRAPPYRASAGALTSYFMGTRARPRFTRELELLNWLISAFLCSYLKNIKQIEKRAFLGVDYTCVLDVRFTDECVFNVIFIVENSKMTLKTHATVKRTYKLHIQNARVINPLPSKSDALIPALF
jgi:hypothetical protein